MGLLTTAVESTPIVGQTMGFVRTAHRVSNTTTPQAAVAVSVEGILEDCLPSNIKYPIK